MNQTTPLPSSMRANDGSEEGLDLFALAKSIRFDRQNGNLTISNGAAAITLMRDGTVRIDAKRIINVSEEGFTISAATIDLN